MKLHSRWLSAAFVFALLIVCGPHSAMAGVTLGGTRIIYPEAEREVTLRMQNESDVPRLVQAWVDDGDASRSAETSNAPFVLTPPLTRIEANHGQALRIVYTGENLPADRESVFWLNVLDVSPRPKGGTTDNYMQVAVRTRIKLFFRPKGLRSDPVSAVEGLRWRLVHDSQGYAVECSNPSAYHVSFGRVWIKGQASEAGDGGMVSPGGTERFHIAGAVGDGAKVAFKVINDYGGITEREAVLTR